MIQKKLFQQKIAVKQAVRDSLANFAERHELRLAARRLRQRRYPLPISTRAEQLPLWPNE